MQYIFITILVISLSDAALPLKLSIVKFTNFDEKDKHTMQSINHLSIRWNG